MFNPAKNIYTIWISEFDMNKHLSKGFGKHAKLQVDYIIIGII